MYNESDLLMLSALQHFIFCPRQCALIHLEQIWEENQYTVEGQFLHQRVHTEQTENRKTLRIEYGMRLRSLELGLSGKADIVEIEYKDDKRKEIKAITPVEYKRGKPKESTADIVQLCAQALCLEEMLGISIQSGLIYYGKKRRRFAVAFTAELRQETINTARDFHLLFVNQKTPPPEFSKKCSMCSLYNHCMPEKVNKSVGKYLESELNLMLGEEDL